MHNPDLMNVLNARDYLLEVFTGLLLHDSLLFHDVLKEFSARGQLHYKIQHVVIFYDNHNIKIVDFGLGNLYNVGRNCDTACGSPCYAAPEMIAGKKYNGFLYFIRSVDGHLELRYYILCHFMWFFAF